MPWLETWAVAVVEASKADSSERLKTVETATTTNRPPLSPLGGAAAVAASAARTTTAAGDQQPITAPAELIGRVAALRQSMKKAVRKKYAFSTSAKLWSEEFER